MKFTIKLVWQSECLYNNSISKTVCLNNHQYTAGHYRNDKQVPSVTALLATTGITNRYPVLQHCWPLQQWQTGTQCYRYPVLQHCWPLQEWQTGTQCYSTAGHYMNDKQVPSVTALLATTGITNRYPVLQHCWPLQQWQTGTQCYRYPVLQHCWPLQEWQTGTQCYSTAGHYMNDKQVPSVTALLATTAITNRYPVLQHCWPLQQWQTGTQCYRYPVLQHCWPLEEWQTGTQCYSTAGH